MRGDALKRWTAIGLCALLGGCTGGAVEGPRDVARPQRDDIVAIIDGVPVARSALEPAMMEIAGAVALEEVALDLLLAAEMARAGLTIEPDAIAGERADLARSLVRAGAVDSAGARALERVFARRGLGPHRLDRLLRRNAALRALVRDSIVVSDDELRLSHRLTYGPRTRARLLMVQDGSLAGALEQRLRSLRASERVQAFDALATEHSTHASASIGGRLEPIHADDPGVPAVLRRQVAGLETGELSEVFAIEDRYGLLLVEGRLDPSPDAPAFEDARDGLEVELRRRKERLAMDRLAARLLEESTIRAVDPALGWSIDAARPR